MMCIKISSLILSFKGHLVEESLLSIDVFESTSHQGGYFVDILAESMAIKDAYYEFNLPNLIIEERIITTDEDEEEILADDRPLRSTKASSMILFEF